MAVSTAAMGTINEWIELQKIATGETLGPEKHNDLKRKQIYLVGSARFARIDPPSLARNQDLHIPCIGVYIPNMHSLWCQRSEHPEHRYSYPGPIFL